MSEIKAKQADPAKKELIRNSYNFTNIVIAFISSTIIWTIHNYNINNLNKETLFQLFLVGIIYCIIYWFFAKMYQAHKIGVYQITELIYFQFLSFGIPDALITIASMLWFRKISLGLLGIGFSTLIIQLILVAINIYLFNRLWVKFDVPQKILFIYGKKGYESILHKMESQNYRYNVIDCIPDNVLFNNIKETVDNCDRVYLFKVNDELRHDLVMYCNKIGRDIYLTRDIEDLITMGYDISHSFDTPFIRTSRNKIKWYYPIIKRAADIVCSGIAIVVLSPILIVVAAAIKLYDGGPALYSQIRLTEGHREFKIYKFRSMITDAEKNGARLAAQNDSRITPIGKLIRATRIDELPQLFNIFKGDMTIVGPRPERPEIEAEYLEKLPEFGLRLQVKAGLTGYAQVFGKYNTTPEDKLKLDLLYINQRSLLLDIKLILYTIKILFIPESTEGVAEGQTTAISNRKTI